MNKPLTTFDIIAIGVYGSGYLHKPKRSEAEARADIAKSRAIETEHERINREFSAHVRACNTPEGQAIRKDFAEFRSEQEGRTLARFMNDLIVWASR